MPELPIKPAAYKFEELFGIGTFRVPRYQRAYDWAEEEVADFARDVDALVGARLNGQPSRHFFGAVISVFEHQAEFEIVDGQQRLTTHMLCLKELRDRWLELGEATRKKKKGVSRFAFDRADEVQEVIFAKKNNLRLVLSKRDKDFFVDLMMDVASEPTAKTDQSHRRLWEAREKLREELFDPLFANVGPFTTRQNKLQAVQDALLEDGYIVHLNSTEGDEAYRLFMVLNDRGKQLSAGDLLRTYTLATLESYQPLQEAAESDWNDILKQDESIVNRFLSAYYVTYTGRRIPTGEMYDRFRKEFLNDPVDSPSSARKMRETVADLHHEASLFARIADGDWPYDEATKTEWEKDRLKRLVKSLSHRLADPLLLVVSSCADENTFRDLVSMIEPFAFRYINIVGASASRLEGVYFRHARKARAGKLDKSGLRSDLRGLLKSYARDETFMVQLQEVLQFSSRKTGGKKLLKYFLTTLESYEDWFKEGAVGKPKVKDRTRVFDLKTVDIEHIYPQNPSKSDPVLNQLKHTLGNLTALDRNEGKVAGNKIFKEKKPIYAASEFKITKPLARLKKWDQERVAKRVEFYTERAVKIFVLK